MKEYDIFKSEGGYRVCLGVYNDGPIMEHSPWFTDLSVAEAFARDKKFDDETGCYGAFRDGNGWIASLPTDDTFSQSDYYNFKKHSAAVEAVLAAIEKMGYSREYILHRRKDLNI